MSVIKLLDRYLPNLPTLETSDEMREYLRSELDLISLAVNGSLDVIDALRSVPRMFLAGDADDFNLDTVDSTLVNYFLGGALGLVPIEPDELLGTIILPLGGVYRLTAYVYGLQPSVTQNETIFLKIAVNGTPTIVMTLDVTSNQTQDRSLAVTLSREFAADDVITMVMSATADLGTFLIQTTSLELTYIQPTDPEAQINLAWE